MIRLGISTCPNDTFAFHALLNDQIDRRGLDLEISLHDIQELNDGLAAGKLDVAKGSYAFALRHIDRLVVLPVGSAIGFGVGPILLGAAGADADPNEHAVNRGEPRVLAPGADTTASLLYHKYFPERAAAQQTNFGAIIPALEAGEAEFGVCIHEARFTHSERGLRLVSDLGQLYERDTGAALPLGGLLAADKVPRQDLSTLTDVIRDSLDAALEDPERALPTMRAHAREFDDEVLLAHVALYVSDATRDLGEVGREALQTFCRAAGPVKGDGAPFSRFFDIA